MSLLLISKAFAGANFVEELRRTFPNGVITLGIYPTLGRANRIILFQTRLINGNSLDIKRQFIGYHAIIANEGLQRLEPLYYMVAREPFAAGSRIFVYDRMENMKYVVSADLTELKDLETGEKFKLNEAIVDPKRILRLRRYKSCQAVFELPSNK